MPTSYATPHRFVYAPSHYSAVHIARVKPFQLLAALMHREGLGPLPLAKKMGKPKLQPQIHRFINGEVANPARSTAAPLAAFFDIPVDAIYEEKVATAVAKHLGLEPVPVILKRRKKAPKSVAPQEFDDDTLLFARKYAKLDPAGRQRVRIFVLAAPPSINPTKIRKAPTTHPSESKPDSGLGRRVDPPPRNPRPLNDGEPGT